MITTHTIWGTEGGPARCAGVPRAPAAPPSQAARPQHPARSRSQGQAAEARWRPPATRAGVEHRAAALARRQSRGNPRHTGARCRRRALIQALRGPAAAVAAAQGRCRAPAAGASELGVGGAPGGARAHELVAPAVVAAPQQVHKPAHSRSVRRSRLSTGAESSRHDSRDEQQAAAARATVGPSAERVRQQLHRLGPRLLSRAPTCGRRTAGRRCRWCPPPRGCPATPRSAPPCTPTCSPAPPARPGAVGLVLPGGNPAHPTLLNSLRPTPRHTAWCVL